MAHVPAPDTCTVPTDERVPCPLCEISGATESDIYVHLQTRHRKSAIASELLESTAAKGTDPA